MYLLLQLQPWSLLHVKLTQTQTSPFGYTGENISPVWCSLCYWYKRILFLLVTLTSHLSGCFWFFAPTFWEVAGTYKSEPTVVGIPWGGVTLIPYHILKKLFELTALKGDGDRKTLGISAHARVCGLKLLPTVIWWNFHYLLFPPFVEEHSLSYFWIDRSTGTRTAMNEQSLPWERDNM